MAESPKPQLFRLKNVRCCFPSVFRPEAYKDDAPKYKIKLLIPKGSDMDLAIREKMVALCQAKGIKDPEKWFRSIKGSKQQNCYLDGDDTAFDTPEGHMVLSAKNSVKPVVVDNVRGADGKPRLLAEEEGKIYSGCRVHVVIDPYVQTGETAGFRCSFSSVCFAGDDEAFSGGRRGSADDFEDLAVEEESYT